MRKVLVLILLVGAFLGGYYCRGLPRSPDVFGWARQAYADLSDDGGAAAPAHREQTSSRSPPAPWDSEPSLSP